MGRPPPGALPSGPVAQKAKHAFSYGLLVVDLRPGDQFIHGPTQKQYKLTAMSAYRQHQLSDELIAAGQVPTDGFLVAK